jgi:hypothetical protein
MVDQSALERWAMPLGSDGDGAILAVGLPDDVQRGEPVWWVVPDDLAERDPGAELARSGTLPYGLRVAVTDRDVDP